MSWNLWPRLCILTTDFLHRHGPHLEGWLVCILSSSALSSNSYSSMVPTSTQHLLWPDVDCGGVDVKGKERNVLGWFYQLPWLACSLTTYSYTGTHTLTPLLRVRSTGWASCYRGDNILGPYITDLFQKNHKEDSSSLWETPKYMTRRNTESQIRGKPERSLISMGPK